MAKFRTKYTDEDFFNLFEKTDTCWLWTGNREPTGYGRFSQEKAHRASYRIHHGAIPAGLVVRHKCDNPPCVNPAHLELGTLADNNRDRHERGRSASDKLTKEQAFDIKYCLRHTEAMRKYPFISQTTITRIRTNKIWKHI